MPFQVDVVTGNKFGCGTNANVFLVLYGDNGDTGERALKKCVHMMIFEKIHTCKHTQLNSHTSLLVLTCSHHRSNNHSDKFERSQTDNFDVRAVDLGKLRKVKVWHDSSGLSPSWFLDKIVVTDTRDSSKYEFPCEKWLSKVGTHYSCLQNITYISHMNKASNSRTCVTASRAESGRPCHGTGAGA